MYIAYGKQLLSVYYLLLIMYCLPFTISFLIYPWGYALWLCYTHMGILVSTTKYVQVFIYAPKYR